VHPGSDAWARYKSCGSGNATGYASGNTSGTAYDIASRHRSDNGSVYEPARKAAPTYYTADLQTGYPIISQTL